MKTPPPFTGIQGSINKCATNCLAAALSYKNPEINGFSVWSAAHTFGYAISRGTYPSDYQNILNLFNKSIKISERTILGDMTVERYIRETINSHRCYLINTSSHTILVYDYLPRTSRFLFWTFPTNKFLAYDPRRGLVSLNPASFKQTIIHRIDL